MTPPARNLKANWARTVKRLRRYAAELAAQDYEVREPDSLDTPPSLRGKGKL